MKRSDRRIWFWTPPLLAQRMAKMTDVNGHHVLEPSAGHGDIAQACLNAGAVGVTCIDNDPEHVRYLKAHGFDAVQANFLERKPVGALQSRIVMCPPFRAGQDVEHVTHALKFLAPGGILVSIMSRATGEPFFHTLSPANGITAARWESLPADTFKGRPAILIKITKV